MLNCSCSTFLSDWIPAPPVSTRVPSISNKRRRLELADITRRILISGPASQAERSILQSENPYRGRLAPSPTGYLHAGHALTFWRAQERCRGCEGVLILRYEDLDGPRCRPEFQEAITADLRWFGLAWQEGPFYQSNRRGFYLRAWRHLRDRGLIYHAPVRDRMCFPRPARRTPRMRNRSIPAPAGQLA
ncbi:MAG: glutamate--tRNA ligase family protein [Chthoniobacterales bacterium]